MGRVDHLRAGEHPTSSRLSATVPERRRELAAWMEEVREEAVDVDRRGAAPRPLIHKLRMPGRVPRSLPEVKQYFIEMGKVRDRYRTRARRSTPNRRKRVNRKVQARAMERDGRRNCCDYARPEARPASRDLVLFQSASDCERLAEGDTVDGQLAVGRREAKASCSTLFDDFADALQAQASTARRPRQPARHRWSRVA